MLCNTKSDAKARKSTGSNEKEGFATPKTQASHRKSKASNRKSRQSRKKSRQKAAKSRQSRKKEGKKPQKQAKKKTLKNPQNGYRASGRKKIFYVKKIIEFSF